MFSLAAHNSRSRNVGASSFCSAYIQASTTIPPSTNSSQAIQSAAPTDTDTTTVCGKHFPSTPVSCGLEGYGYESNLIVQIKHTSPTECHLSCLADWNCKSFQTQLSGIRFCNLYTAPVPGNAQAALGVGYFFYDMTCSNYLTVSITGELCFVLRLNRISGSMCFDDIECDNLQ